MNACRSRGQGRVLAIVWSPLYIGFTFIKGMNEIVKEAVGCKTSEGRYEEDIVIVMRLGRVRRLKRMTP